MADQIEHLEGQLQIHFLAALDMREVVAACDALEPEPDSNDLTRVLTTAMVVAYARPFTNNTIGALPNRWDASVRYPAARDPRLASNRA